MCKHALHPLLARLPKTEHHLHLEGTLEPELLFALAGRNGIALPVDDAAFADEGTLLRRYEDFASLDDFLHYYAVGISTLVKVEDYEALAWAYFLRAHADGVRHAEVFFDPQAHTSRGIGLKTVLNGIGKARRRAETELGLSTLVIPCILKPFPVPDALALLNSEEFKAAVKEGEVTGIGICGSEAAYPPVLFKEVYATAKEMGLRLTAHAGEEGPAAYVAGALDDLGVERVDHGIAITGDDALVRRAAEEKIMLTVCPLSNVRLRCVKQVKDLPFRRFLDEGVRFSINSDDPAYFGGYILDNYCAVQESFDLTVKEWEKVIRDNIDSSWCSDKRKAELLTMLDDVLNEWNSS
ncbi:adenosine deaminase [Trichodelitschia bisporula]|uniref:Adenine deaminase n=1 Tax=Trichodelitschia bisporula TaxID=703511 RepID=A0A6G1HJ20_9PEZI|nr:adenosine deaminase [Trichodelitschia bisporula]